MINELARGVRSSLTTGLRCVGFCVLTGISLTACTVPVETTSIESDTSGGVEQSAQPGL